MMEMIDKINEISKLKKGFQIEVDGGINNETIQYVKDVDIIVSGSYICESDNYDLQINKLRDLSKQ